MPGTILAALAGNMISNATSEWHADNQMKREEKLMNKQNALNRANALDAYSQQVQGARLAGLNPAMLNGQTPNVAAPVSKGSVGQAENVEFDPATLLMEAQRENIEAQTAKTEAETAKIEGVDTKNVQADIDLKTAQTLTEGEKPANIKMDTKKKGFEINKTWAESENLYAQKPNIEAQTRKTQVDATRISQLNQQYKDQNKTLQKIGPQIANEIIDSPAFKDFDESTQLYFKKVANGELKLTVGGLDAVNNLIQSNDKIRSTDKDALNYSFNKKILSIQDDPNTIEALAKMPELERQKAEKILDKFTSEIASINADKSLKDEQIKLNKIQQAAQNLENNIKAISPEGRASAGDDWGYIKSLARSYAEEPTKLLAPLGALKLSKDMVNKKPNNNEYEYKKDHPLHNNKPTDGVQNMKIKTRRK